MKKLLGLMIAMLMLLSVTTVAFAATGDAVEDPFNLTAAECPAQTAEIAAEATVYYQLNGFSGMEVSISGDNLLAEIGELRRGKIYWSELETVDESASTLVENSEQLIRITNTGSAATVYTIDAQVVAGTWDNPQLVEEGEYYPVELAEGSGGYYFQWTATKEGKLIANIYGDVDCMITVSNQTTGSNESGESKDKSYMTGAGVNVSVGDVVTIQVSTFDVNWGPNPAGEITMSFYIAPVGQYENPEIIDEIGNVSAELAEKNEGYYFKWAANESGKLTITISSDKDCLLTLNNLTSGKQTDMAYSSEAPYTAEASIEIAVGDVILIQVGTFDPGYGDNPAGEIKVSFAIEAGEDSGSGDGSEGGTDGSEEPEEPEKPAYIVDSSVELIVGENTLTPSADAITTIYEFSPDQDGIYLFETAEGNLLGYWGGNKFFVFDGTENKTNSLKHTVEAVGQTIMVGVQASGENCTIKVTRVGDRPKTADDFEWNNVEATGKPVSGDKLEGEWNWVNVKDDVKDVAVLGKDGYYHLNSADGPILYLELTSKRFNIDLVEMCSKGQLRYTIQTGEETWEKVQYKTMFNTYLEAGNVVALTEELVEMLQKVGAVKGWYDTNAQFLFNQEVDADEAWMFACKYIEGHNSLPSVDVDPVPPTADTSAVLMSTLAILMAAAAITAIYTNKRRFA